MNTAVSTQNVETALHFIDIMAPGECQVLHNVSWDEYEELLDELGPGYAVRVAFTEGELEIMSPLYKHEVYKDVLTMLVRILGKACKQRVQSAGSLTLKRKNLRRGAEPDTCFYLQNAAQILGQEMIDLRYDPPPDLVVEVDITSKSTSKMKTYAKLGVPEFWRYDGKRIRIYALLEGDYVERDNSLSFPIVSALDLVLFLKQSIEEGQDEAFEAFQHWVNKRSENS